MYSNNLCFYACETHYFHLSSAIQATATDSYAQLKTKFEKHEINTLVDIELCNIQYNLLIFNIFYNFSSGFRIQGGKCRVLEYPGAALIHEHLGSGMACEQR